MSSSTISSFLNPRHVVQKVLSRPQREGVDAIIRRSIGRPELRNLDPFLMLDEIKDSSPKGGFPDHPHRGFETVTYMFQGSINHEDFKGHKGTINAGDLQWMTAGRGIVHSEMPAGDGAHHGLQLWVNLSSKDKMIEPNYQELASKDVAKVHTDKIDVSVIAGESFGVKSPVYTRTPTMFLDFTMKPGSQLNQAIPENWNSFVYVIDGEGVFGPGSSRENQSPVSAHHTLVLSSPGDGVSVCNLESSGKDLRFVLIGGLPLNEPIVQYGPFVMNTNAEIEMAIKDYQLCRNGFENARHWKSGSLSK